MKYFIEFLCSFKAIFTVCDESHEHFSVQFGGKYCAFMTLRYFVFSQSCNVLETHVEVLLY